MVAAMTMVLGMSSMTTFAASIEVDRDATFKFNVDPNDESTTKYTIYKIFDASYTNNSATNEQADKTPVNTAENISYTIASDSAWVPVLGSFTGDIFTPANGQHWITLSKNAGGSYNVTATNSLKTQEDAATFAAWLLANKGDIQGEQKSITASEKLVTFDNLDKGYYLISSDNGTNLVLATSDIKIIEKNTYPGIKKEVDKNDNNAQIGDTITYTIKVSVPTGADKQIKVTDTMSKGLTFKEISSVTVPGATVDAKPVDVTYTNTDVDTNNSFSITFDANTVKANAGKTITITYKAILNENAVVQGTDANTNKAVLDYGEFHSQESTPGVDTQQITIRKYDGNEKKGDDAEYTPIENAVFEVHDADGNVINLIKVSNTEYRVATAAEQENKTAESHALGNARVKSIAAKSLVKDIVTVKNNVITIKGLDADKNYQLVETQAPAGYTALASNVNVKEISTAENATNEKDIANYKGATLPSTGGMGTTIFYVLGAALVIGAGVVLVTRRRLSK